MEHGMTFLASPSITDIEPCAGLRVKHAIQSILKK